MKKFKYRVESYLKFLKFEQEKALKELKKVENYRNNLKQRYFWMEGEMKKAWQFNSEMGKGHKNIHYVQDNNQFIQNLKVHMAHLSGEIAAADEEYQKKYKALLELQLKVKKMELHKEGEHQKYRKERKKIMQKQTDEINSTRKRGHDAKPL